MLYTFFVTQWNNPTRGDWTLEVKQDLEDFGIPCSCELIQSKSKLSFKNMVKVRAEEYAFNSLRRKQNTHSKMENLTCSSLKMQQYLSSQEIKTSEKRTIFKYHTRMERFGENFRGSQGPILCPLCQKHLDNQEHSYQCPEIRKGLEVKGSLSDIYKKEIKPETIKIAVKIAEFRQQNLGY